VFIEHGIKLWKGLFFGLQLYMQNVPIELDFKGRHIVGVADPVARKCKEGIPLSHIIYINGKFVGTLHCEKNGWVMDRPVDSDLVESLGEYLHAWYE
jgi:hypothetical protein